MRGSRYTAAEIDYLRLAWPVLTMQEILEEFVLRFRRVINYGQLKPTLSNHKIKRGHRRKRAPGAPCISTIYSDEQLAFIAEKYKDYPLKEVVPMLNGKFDTNFTKQQLKTCTNRHDIRAGRNGRFEKGAAPWNAGTKGLVKPNRGNFTRQCTGKYKAYRS